MSRALKGEMRAFEELVRANQNKVFNFCYRSMGSRSDAEELAQETFIKAYRGLASFDCERSFSTWLFAIAHNALVDWFRARRPEEPYSGGGLVVEEIPGSTGEPEPEAIGRELRLSLEVALGQLPYDYRAVLVLRHIEGLSYQEIAEVLGVPTGTVKTWIHRARVSLRKRMEAADDEM